MIEIKHEGRHFCNLCGSTDSETSSIYLRCSVDKYISPGGLIVQLCPQCQEQLADALYAGLRNPNNDIVYLPMEEVK